MSALSVWAVVIVLAASSISIGVLIARVAWRRQRVESGWQSWTRSATALPVRERVALAWSMSTGRAVADPRIAAHAVQRGEAGRALMDAVRPRLTWAWRLISVPMIALAIIAFANHAIGTGVFTLAFAALFLAMPLFHTLDRNRVQRSVTANRKLTADG